MFTPVDRNNGSNATINADPCEGTYIERRIDYIMPSDTAASFGVSGSILNTWTYTAETIPAGLQLVDTIDASDHLPLYMVIAIPQPGDLDGDGGVDMADFSLFVSRWLDTGCSAENNWCDEADISGNGEVDLADLAEFAAQRN